MMSVATKDEVFFLFIYFDCFIYFCLQEIQNGKLLNLLK